MNYASVVSHETVRIAHTIDALNELQLKCGDVLNAHITAPVMELIRTTLGTYFKYDQGKTEIIVCSLYSLKSSGANFRKYHG